MTPPPWIRVVFWLACLAASARAGVEFTPFSTPIALPESFKGKPVWAIERLPSGELAVGVEGAVAIGVPGADWRIAATPGGGAAIIVSRAHGRTLVAGSGFCAFWEEEGLAPLPEASGTYRSAAAVTEGWILAGTTGVVLVHPDGTVVNLMTASRSTGEPMVARQSGRVWVATPLRMPSAWQDGQLRELPRPGLRSAHQVFWIQEDYCLTDSGLFSADDRPLLAPATCTDLFNYDKSWVIAGAQAPPWLLFATYRRGLVALLPGGSQPAWTWPESGVFYRFHRDGPQFLCGTDLGALALASPGTVRIARVTLPDIRHLEATELGATMVNDDQVVSVGTGSDCPAGQQWPQSAGIVVRNGGLDYEGRHYSGVTPVSGLAVCNQILAVASRNSLWFFGQGKDAIEVGLPNTLDSLATDGHVFLAATLGDGIQILDTAGNRLTTLGKGRSHVRTLRPGRTVLLFQDGDVRDPENHLLGRTIAGCPRDAALVSAREEDGATIEDQMAVLVTRADGAPIIGLLDRSHWRPLDIPGLGEIDAKLIAAGGGFLYVAGQHGVLQVREPLPLSSVPALEWRWQDQTTAMTLRLPSDKDDRASIIPGRWEAVTQVPTRHRLRLPNGEWIHGATGQAWSVPVSWGNNDIVLEAERQGLVATQHLTVIRPYPWLLRPLGIALEALTLGLAMFGVARLRTRRLERQKRELEARVEQRTLELRKANAAKEEFLASVSHEIRNPLNGVVGICAILQEADVGPREKNFVRVLSGCADQLRSMLDDILDFSRIERGELTVSASVFELRSLVEEAARVMDPLLESCALMLPEEERWFVGDSGKIRQIVCNLVSNAFKYGRPREAGIEVRIAPEGLNRSRLRIAVRNTGPTIPPDELPRLFESFRRGTTAGNAPGSGLGLAVCRRLAEAMGGRMTAASANETTEFALELLLDQSHRPESRRANAEVVSRVLAIEDEEYNRLALGHVLRSLGYTIDWAPDGAAALQLAGRNPYDLVVTDWRLPDTDGGTLCRQLLDILPEPKPPIIAVTAYSTGEKLEEAKTAGMAAFITKPVTREKLERLIRDLSAGINPRRSLDVNRRAAANPLAELGDLAPSVEKLAADIAASWQQVEALAQLRDPRTARLAHALRSLLLLAGESDAAEQLGLLESAASEQDWDTAHRLLPVLAEDIGNVRSRLKLG